MDKTGQKKIFCGVSADFINGPKIDFCVYLTAIQKERY